MEKEAKARIRINRLLEHAGWRFFDDENGPANIALEVNVKIKKKVIDKFGDDFEKTGNGFVDYMLLDSKGFPCAVLEAKSEKLDPLVGKEQARKYAKSLNVRFIILSNGNLHYFWDLEHGNPSIITDIPSQESLGQYRTFKPNPDNLVKEKVEADYIAITQDPMYSSAPRWNNPDERDAFIKENNLKFLRHYQLKAIYALQKAVKSGSNRFLFEMATGTGKTLASAAVIKLFLRTGNANRVLFLVDRIELENQAWKNLVRTLKNDYTCVIYKENRDDWHKAEIVVSTVQSLAFNNKYRSLFSPTDFDLVISDEAHRSISGNSRAVFEYFVGYKLGLTATPKDYLKKIDPDKISKKDPREWERRQLLDSYITFGCESGVPTFRYSLIDGVKDGFLVNPVVVDARTEISTQLLSDLGYSVLVENDEGELEEKIFYQKDFEKKFFSEKTNKILCKTFLENAIRDPLSNEIGKSIAFCVSQNHASKITQTLNIYADSLFPGKYNSDFAVQVTSMIPDAQQFSISFANNNLNGHTRVLEGYISSKTRVCVTVGMMTTGYDCEDILNLCLMRPIFSPTDFIQIKGRGTRRYTFLHKIKEDGRVEEYKDEKGTFKLFDFFATCEYFEEKFNYDEVLELPPTGTGTGDGDGGGIDIDEYESIQPDPLSSYVESRVGLHGMKIDRKFYDQFEETVKKDDTVREHYERGDIKAAEEYIRENLFDKPEEFFNLEKLRKSVHLDRRLKLWEIIEKAFGGIERFKSKDELLDEELDKFVSIHKPDASHISRIRDFFKAYITDNEIRDIIEKEEYARLATNPKVTISDLKDLEGWRDVIPEYVKDYVSLNTFM